MIDKWIYYTRSSSEIFCAVSITRQLRYDHGKINKVRYRKQIMLNIRVKYIAQCTLCGQRCNIFLTWA